MSEIEIRITENGPYLVYGDVTIKDADGQPYDTGEKRVVALCRCGGSATKPFCDGTHARKGFDASERAVVVETQEPGSP